MEYNKRWFVVYLGEVFILEVDFSYVCCTYFREIYLACFSFFYEIYSLWFVFVKFISIFTCLLDKYLVVFGLVDGVFF